MTIEAAAAAPPPRPRDVLRARWPLAAGLLVLAIPTVIRLGRESWSTEIGAHGPIVLATGLWLLFHDGLRLDGDPRAPRRWWAVALLPALALYVFGRAYDFLSLEAAGLWGAFVALVYLVAGGAALRRRLFPLVYLGFVIPPPGWVIDRITAPLQTFVSAAAVHLLQPLGYPIAHDGVVLTEWQYQLLVEDACAGMNSLTGLVAIGLFYVYLLHRASWRYSALMVALIVPIAILVNVARVVALILLTWHAGDAAAQGFLHVTTGLVLFMVAIGLMFLADTGLQALVRRRGQGRGAA
ncbi:exosortase V [Sphingomonas sp. MMS24-JH45]